MQRLRMILGAMILVMALLACKRFNQGAGGAPTPTAEPSSSGYNTGFPLPHSVINFTDTGSAPVNFHTKISLDDTIHGYRAAFAGRALRERTALTVTTSGMFTMVFDGNSSDQAIGIQRSDLGNGLTNLKIHCEKV